jgi:hypothetical protein
METDLGLCILYSRNYFVLYCYICNHEITLSKLNVRSECNINFAKTFDIADEPITEGINFEIDAQSENADNQKLHEILAIAEEKCPPCIVCDM